MGWRLKQENPLKRDDPTHPKLLLSQYLLLIQLHSKQKKKNDEKEWEHEQISRDFRAN
jgi:hypothetical protein